MAMPMNESYLPFNVFFFGSFLRAPFAVLRPSRSLANAKREP